MRKMCVLSLAALFFLTCDFARSRTVKVPSKWVVGPVILSAGEKGSSDDVAVKDPTIVYYQGKWHLFYMVSGKEPGDKSAQDKWGKVWPGRVRGGHYSLRSTLSTTACDRLSRRVGRLNLERGPRRLCWGLLSRRRFAC